MKIAYLDCFSGISGDMCLGALLDAGVSPEKLLRELQKLPVKNYQIRISKVKRAGISATKADVIVEAKGIERRAKDKSKEHRAKSKDTRVKIEEQGAKRWEDIEKIIHKSSLSEGIKEKGLRVFRRLFKAEAKIHGKGFKTVHLHELGAVDCLIDVFGTIIGFNILGVEKIYSSPINLGSGFIKTDHGILPVPAPASAETLKGVPVYSTDSNFELTTPTGAALVRELSSEFGDLPMMDIETIGLGAGNRNFKDRPNILRLFVGNPFESFCSPHLTHLYPPFVSGNLKDTEGRGITGNPPIPPLVKGGKEGFLDEIATVIEANIDDMNPQIYEYLMERLFEKGALDVFLTQVIMKKGRPGIKLTVLCKKTEIEEMIKIILTETTTIGLRFYDVQRSVLQREIKIIDTEFGKLRVKFSRLGKEIFKATPEYEDCKRLARKLNVPLIEIMRKIKIPASD